MPATSIKRYAQAVFEIALENNMLAEWQVDLQKIALLMQDDEFATLVESPKLPTELKAKLAEEKLGGVNPLALNLVYLLIAKGKLKYADQIAREYETLLNEHYGISHAEIITAIRLDKPDEESLIRHIQAMVGRKISAAPRVDPDILGGFIARVGDSLIDGSIRNKLNELRKSLAQTRR